MKEKGFTKKERDLIYIKALNHFKKSQKNKTTQVDGMCDSIRYAIDHTIAPINVWNKINKKFLPEFFAFKPKITYYKNNIYWFTNDPNEDGYDKRVSILTALVEGKSPRQWKKEWLMNKNK